MAYIFPLSILRYQVEILCYQKSVCSSVSTIMISGY